MSMDANGRSLDELGDERGHDGIGTGETTPTFMRRVPSSPSTERKAWHVRPSMVPMEMVHWRARSSMRTRGLVPMEKEAWCTQPSGVATSWRRRMGGPGGGEWEDMAAAKGLEETEESTSWRTTMT
jgi:hypothetical protein